MAVGTPHGYETDAVRSLAWILALSLPQATPLEAVEGGFVLGYGGFPRWEGGPVFWARQQNRTLLKENLQALAREAGAGFVLADLSVLLD